MWLKRNLVLKMKKEIEVANLNMFPSSGRAGAASCLPAPPPNPGSAAAPPGRGGGWRDGQREEHPDPPVHSGGAAGRRQGGAALQHRGDAAPPDLRHEPGQQGQPGAGLRRRAGVKGERRGHSKDLGIKQTV